MSLEFLILGPRQGRDKPARVAARNERRPGKPVRHDTEGPTGRDNDDRSASVNPTHTARRFRSHGRGTTPGFRPGKRFYGDVVPARRHIDAPLADSIGSQRRNCIHDVVQNAGHGCPQAGSKVCITKEWRTVFGAEDHMKNDAGMGLRHDGGLSRPVGPLHHFFPATPGPSLVPRCDPGWLVSGLWAVKM